MIGQLPTDFLRQFLAILESSPDKALALEEQINDVCQRQWLQAQMDVLPQMEQDTFGRILRQDGISAGTLNEFLEQRLPEQQRIDLWADSQLKIWTEIMQTVEKVTTAEQRQAIKELIAKYK